MEIYPGNYEDYQWRKQHPVDSTAPGSSQLSAVSSQLVRPVPRSEDVSPANGDRAPVTDAEPRGERVNPIKRKQMEDQLHDVEEEIARAEAGIALCETQLQSFVSAEETQRQTQDLARGKADLQRLMAEWEELSGTIETTG